MVRWRWLVGVVFGATTACEQMSAEPSPLVEWVDPHVWEVDEPPSEFTIHGQHFYLRVRTDSIDLPVATNDRFRTTVGARPAPTDWLDNQTLAADTPTDLPAGVHSLVVTSPYGARAVLEDAIEIFEPGEAPIGQRREGPAEIGASELETTVAIDAVDPHSSVLFFNVTHASGEPGTGLIAGWLAGDGSSVTFARNTTQLYDDPSQLANETVSIRWTVLELSGVHVLRDQTVIGSELDTDLDLPAAVDPTRAFVIATHNLDGGHFAGNDWVRARLVDDRTLRVSFQQTAPGALVAWQVIEIHGGTVTSGDVSLTNGANSASVPLAAAPLENSFLLFTENVHGSTQNADGASALVSGRLTSETEVVFERYIGWTAADVDISWFRVTWPRMHVQHGVMPFDPGELAKSVILGTPVSTEHTVSLLAGQMRQGMADQGDDRVGAGWFTTELTDGGARLQLTRGVSDSSARATWQVVELP